VVVYLSQIEHIILWCVHNSHVMEKLCGDFLYVMPTTHSYFLLTLELSLITYLYTTAP